MKHSTDEDTVKKKMKLTFTYRRNLVLNPLHSSYILSDFPRFKDVKGLVIIIWKLLDTMQTAITGQLMKFWNCLSSPLPQVEQDFLLMFGEGVSGKLLERWPTTFKKKIIQQCRKLPAICEIEELLLAADPPEDNSEAVFDFGKFEDAIEWHICIY